jgi:hypothetical protein
MGQYWLHYIGKGLYSIGSFEDEAQRYGVQRSIPFFFLSKFKWGDVVLLAQWLNGNAEVFGYFRVEAVVDNLPLNVKNLLNSKLDVVGVESSGGKFEARLCGSYMIGLVVSVKDDLESYFYKVVEACREAKVNPNDYKWFIRGTYIPISSFLLSPSVFTRSYVKVEIEDLNLETFEDDVELRVKASIWIFDYKQRKYIAKRVREVLKSAKLEDFM